MPSHIIEYMTVGRYGEDRTIRPIVSIYNVNMSRRGKSGGNDNDDDGGLTDPDS